MCTHVLAEPRVAVMSGKRESFNTLKRNRSETAMNQGMIGSPWGVQGWVSHGKKNTFNSGQGPKLTLLALI
ncbi:hypothetical protein J6590_005673 [Homalodisca vitripennis]|nr:hypothetical protein J6590_005673 [Homalodisca vitripennis]